MATPQLISTIDYGQHGRIIIIEESYVNHGYGHRNEHLKKRVNQYTKNGEFITSYDSLADASEITGTNLSSICNCCQNRKQKTANGFMWQYDNSKYKLKEVPLDRILTL